MATKNVLRMSSLMHRNLGLYKDYKGYKTI